MAASRAKPQIVMIGSRGSGKSVLLKCLTGVSTGRNTTCPIEWRIRPSNTWSASVSIAAIYPVFLSTSGSMILDDRSPSKVGNATSPKELMILLKRAELTAFYAPTVSDAKEAAEYQDILLAEKPSRGVIIVNLESPTLRAYEGDYTIIDLPGLTNHGYDSKIKYYRSLARHYILQDTIVAVLVHISEAEDESFSLRYARMLVEDARISVILTYPELASTQPRPAWLDDAKRPYMLFSFKMPDATPNGVFEAQDVQLLRQEEAAYFLFSPVWSKYHHQLGLGVPKILQGWMTLWKQASSEKARSGPRLYHWIFSALLVLASM